MNKAIHLVTPVIQRARGRHVRGKCLVCNQAPGEKAMVAGISIFDERLGPRFGIAHTACITKQLKEAKRQLEDCTKILKISTITKGLRCPECKLTLQRCTCDADEGENCLRCGGDFPTYDLDDGLCSECEERTHNSDADEDDNDDNSDDDGEAYW